MAFPTSLMWPFGTLLPLISTICLTISLHSLTPSQGQAVIRMIPKSSGACRVSDFRPISLLNTDYKIMASVLVRCLRQSLPTTIRSHEKGGVPGRLINDNLCLFRDVIQPMNSTEDWPGMSWFRPFNCGYRTCHWSCRFWKSLRSEIFYRASYNRITCPLQSWRYLHTSRNPCITYKESFVVLHIGAGETQWYIETTIAIGPKRCAVRRKLKS